mmetsp:Transcript_13599/g.43904  ORF Transcript_13599/g.43904 Transcript_13599/m.43904 type:complete len:209 (+) Transcript_13599:490-1116(+)
MVAVVAVDLRHVARVDGEGGRLRPHRHPPVGRLPVANLKRVAADVLAQHRQEARVLVRRDAELGRVLARVRRVVVEAQVRGVLRAAQVRLEEVGGHAEPKREESRQPRRDAGEGVVVLEHRRSKGRQQVGGREAVVPVEGAVASVSVGERPVHRRRAAKVEALLPVAPLLCQLVVVPAAAVVGRASHALLDLHRQRKEGALLLLRPRA